VNLPPSFRGSPAGARARSQAWHCSDAVWRGRAIAFTRQKPWRPRVRDRPACSLRVSAASCRHYACAPSRPPAPARRSGQSDRRSPAPCWTRCNRNPQPITAISWLTMTASTRALGLRPRKIVGCGRPSHLRARGFCGVHYGLPGTPTRIRTRVIVGPATVLLATARSPGRQFARPEFLRWRRDAAPSRPQRTSDVRQDGLRCLIDQEPQP
jgi:hypothetical protein